MIFRSNLTCPNLTPHFKHLTVRPMGHSFGHSVPSDWADKADDDPVFGLYKKCGLWTHDEAAILFNVAKSMGYGTWVDVGSHTGWTTAHIVEAHHHPTLYCWSVDPMYAVEAFRLRASENITASGHSCQYGLCGQTSATFLGGYGRYDGVCIDGDHSEGKPLEDAQNSVRHLAETGVIMFHDGVGRPVREAVEWLMSQGFKTRAYFTPHLVFCCWRGEFTPPDHEPDPEVKRQLLDGRFSDFDFGACV